MKLAEFLETNMEELLQDWEEAVLEIAPELKGRGSFVLRDHARDMLEFIIKDLGTDQSVAQAASKALGKGRVADRYGAEEHGTQRHQEGMTLMQMVQELRALRARVTKAWGDQQQGLTGDDIDELVRFNEAIDQLVAFSIASFTVLREQTTRLIEAVLSASPDPTAIYEPDGKYLYLNTAMADLVNATTQDLVGKNPLELNLDVAAEFDDAISTSVTSGQPQRREYHHVSPSGHDMYLDCQFVPVFDDQNEVEAVVKTSRDITDRKKNEYQVWRSANFDTLTGLPNRRLFLDRLEQTLLEAERMGHSFALLFIDLDYFKQANDQLGHEAGDRLLIQVAERLSIKVRAMDTVARLGGDEFTIILKETGKEGGTEAATALLAILEKAFDVDSHRVSISCSIGVTVFPDDGKEVDQLIHNADQAMYAAKEQGGQQVHSYESWMAENESEHMRLNRQLEAALRKHQLEVYYQPIIDIGTDTIYGAEALLRWNHPDQGLLAPEAFLGLTQLNGMTDRITDYVLEQAVGWQIRWRNRNNETVPISINESPSSFATRSLVDQWQARLAKHGFDESWITMELTPASLNNLRAFGFSPVNKSGLPSTRLKFAIDGFGVEPSSLFALQELKMDSVKIDRELIKNAGQGGKADRMLEGIIAMAHAIDVKVVGMGVENDEQLQFLSRAGCDYAQGFLISKPLRQDDFEAFLAQSRNTSGLS